MTSAKPIVEDVKSNKRRHLLPFLTVLGVLGGVALGFILRAARSDPWSRREVIYIGYIGQLFLRALRALIIPLIISSLVSAIGNLDISRSRKIGLRALAYYLLTTLSAVILGIILVLAIHPGGRDDSLKVQDTDIRKSNTVDLLMDLVRNMFPPNLIQATFQSYRTVVVPPKTISWEDQEIYMKKYVNWTGNIEDLPTDEHYIKGEYANSMNIMGLVSFSIALGIALSKLGSRGKPLLGVFDALSEASMMITSALIWISPLGILSLVASMVLKMKSLSLLLGQLGMYFLTVMVGVLVHGFVVLPIIYIVLTRQWPFKFIANMSSALLTAFATASSSAALPVTFQCLEQKNMVDPRVSRFVVPIGTTINMDGTALYEAVAAIFIAQVRGHDLTIGSIAAISFTATAAAVGAASIPQAGLVTMVMVLDVIGLPAEDVTLILAVDWLLDRFRTMVNVLGDSLGTGILYELSKKDDLLKDEDSCTTRI